MLPPEHRVRHSAEFTQVVRRGVRAARPLLVVHLLLDQQPSGPAAGLSAAGLVVSKAVGGAVVRHRTSRRLRHLLLEPLQTLPAGTHVVVRALGGAGLASSAALGRDLEGALANALAKALRVARARPVLTANGAGDHRPPDEHVVPYGDAAPHRSTLPGGA